MDTPIRTLIHLFRTSQDLPEFFRLVFLYGSWPALRPCASAYRAVVARKVRMVAVVGSLGKTTTSRLLAKALTRKIPQNIHFNAYANVAKTMLKIRPGQRHGVIEVGISKPGIMRQYARLVRPDVVVVTSIASEHHNSFKTLETTRDEKAEMVRALSPSGVAVLNGDDPNVLWMEEQTQARVVTFGFGEACHVRARDVALNWPDGTTFQIEVSGKTYPASTRLLGQTMVYPVLATVAAGLAEGRGVPEILAAIRSVPPARGRLRPMELPSGAWLLRDETKSTLETIDVSLDLLEQIPARRKFIVLGAISEPPRPQGPAYRRLGARVAGMVDQAVIVGENRTFKYYASEAFRAGMDRSSLGHARNSPLEALDLLPDDLGPGDVILVKGRDRQRMERVSMALAGRVVRCTLADCPMLSSIRCNACEHA